GSVLTENDCVIEVHPGVGAVAPAEWDALLGAQAQPTPFMRHAYLLAMETSRSVGAETGWEPVTLTVRLRDGGALMAAAAAYLKTHSYGEYVFDWAWADAYRRYGVAYYPKLLVAVPFTPVPGSRLLARDAPARALLLRALGALARETECSSVHLLFGDDADYDAARASRWMMRQGVQFHWHNRHDLAPDGGETTPIVLPYADFADFLAGLQRDKRKKISQERRRVGEAGVSFETLEGAQLSDADWDFFHACYRNTYAEHFSTPYLTREFFARMHDTMPDHWVMFVASRGGRRVACSLIAIDRAEGAAFGRYWGALESIPYVHFEACYYQPLQWCIANRFRRFEGGAQGEHKMARGLMPARTQSAHWIAEPEFARAIGSHLKQESGAIDEYLSELDDRSPFKAP
ncbi:MAG: GNAT family N-acetyltransferase, partial [Vitreoscilla sp.]